jgi:uncharacterized protein YcfJ
MKLLITSALLILAVSPLAQAHHKHNYYASDKQHRGVYKAKVINSTPVYKYVKVRQPQTYCEPTVTHKSHRRAHDKGAKIVGGIVGGFIGHAASDNQHKGLGTIVGAVVGSSIAHKVVRTNNRDTGHYQRQQNCMQTYKKARKIRVLDGYNVTYRAKGKFYQTFMQDKPAKYISIRR